MTLEHQQREHHVHLNTKQSPDNPTTAFTAPHDTSDQHATSSMTTTSSTTATSAFTFNNDRGNDCGPCQQMLHQVLQQAHSRPRALLASMQASFAPVQNHPKQSSATESSKSESSNSSTIAPSLHWRTTEEGNIQVRIPTEASMPPIPLQERTWMRIQPPMIAGPSNSNDTKTPSSPFAGSRLFSATSSSSTGNPQAAVEHQQQSSSPAASNSKVVVSNSIASRLPLPHIRQSSTNSDSPPPEHPQNTSSNPPSHSSSSNNNNGNISTSKDVTSNLTEWMNISCQVCPNTGPKGNARAFVNGPEPLDIVVCSNRLRHTPGTPAALREMEEILTHEMVHVYDARQFQLDLRQCENLAYSEVRAAREAECRFAPPSLFRPSLSACIRERAVTATHNLFPTTARQCVQRVFETALKDERPFVNQYTSAPSSHTATTPQRESVPLSQR